MINQNQFQGFFRDVKCPECKEPLEMPAWGNIDKPFQLNGDSPKEGCIKFHDSLNGQWDKYKADLITDAEFQTWLNQFRD